MTRGRSTAEGTARFAARFPEAVANRFFRTAQALTLSSLGLGTYLGPMTDRADDRYEDAILAAIRGGINVLDTAINYRNQRSERMIGNVLVEAAVPRDEVVICTKGGFLTPEAGAENAQETAGGMHSMHPDFLADQIERSLESLQLDTIDVYYLHNPETQLRFVSREEFEARLRRAFTRLEDEAVRGRIAWYGAATWDGLRRDGQLSLRRMVELAREIAGDEHHFRFIQLPVNLAMPEAFTRAHDEDRGVTASLVEVAARAGVTVMASASLLQARLASGLPALLAAKLPGPETDAQRAIQFTRSTPGLTTALVGVSDAAHVRENLGVMRFPPAPPEQFLALFEREK